MKIFKTNFKDLVEIKLDKFKDNRGNFVKILNKKNSTKFKNDCYESYLTVSKKGSVRGLHGQKGKFSQGKLIYCIQGELVDIAIDLRKKSKTFGKIYKKKINSNDSMAIFIPKGYLHGIISLKNNSVMINYCSSPYTPKEEIGIRLNTVPIKLPKINLIFTKKDKNLPSYEKFFKDLS